MASSGVIPLPPPVLPPPYHSIQMRPKPPWLPNTGPPPSAVQQARIVSPVRQIEVSSPKIEPPPSPPPCESPGATTSGECSSPLRKTKRTRRKRCGQCDGCLKRDNCGTCCVCTNPHSTNTICKHRRCEVLTRRRTSLERATPTSSVQRNLFSSPSPLFSVDGLPNGVPFHFPPSFSPGLPSFPLRAETHPTPVKDPPRRRRRQNNSYQPYKTPIKDPLPCGCPGTDEGFYYTHLGAAETPEALRAMLEERFSVTGRQLRLLEIAFTGIEAKTSEGCPTAEWVVRRTSKEELFLALYRHHKGHVCDKIYTVVSIVLWEGISQARTELIYNNLTSTLPRHGVPTSRRCATNEAKTCSCQGTDSNVPGGASYSFGCSWSVYYNGCKFSRSKVPRKFKLTDESQEPALEDMLQSLASDLGPVYKWMAPDSYANQVATQAAGQECRLGNGEERAFSGITCCMDFCAHSHYDRQNMVHGGATVVCTILKKGVLQQETSEDSEQLHVLPLYRLKDCPKESVPGIEVRPVESYIKPSPTPSRAPTPAPLTTNTHPSLPLHLLHPSSSSSPASSPLALPVGGIKREVSEENGLPPPGTLLPLQNKVHGDDGKTTPPLATPPMAAISRDLSSSMSSFNETPPRQTAPQYMPNQTPPLHMPSQSEDSLSSPPSVSTQGSAQKTHPPMWANGFHNANGLSGNGFCRNAAIQTYLAQYGKPENGKTTVNGHVVNGHRLNGLSPHLFQDGSSSSTDSDSDYSHRQDSPQHSLKGPGVRPPTPSWPAINGVHVKKESHQTEGSPNPPLHPLSSLPLKQPHQMTFNGYNHQLERSQSVSLEKQLERAISSAQKLPHGAPPPPYFQSPSTPGKLFMGQNSISQDDEEEEEEEEMENKMTDRFHAIPGGVAMALDHGSILIECAKRELHATTPIKNPSRSMPTRISMVFYQHKTMTRRYHGWFEEEDKQRKRREEEARNKAAKEHAAQQQGSVMQFTPQPAVAGGRLPTRFFNPAFPLRPMYEDSGMEDSQSEVDPDDLDDIFDPFMYEDVQPPVAIGRVPKPVPLSQVEDPFYLELPVKKVDSMEEQMHHPTLKTLHYPSPFVCTPTPITSSCHYSLCKPTNIYSGNWTRISTFTTTTTRISET